MTEVDEVGIIAGDVSTIVTENRGCENLRVRRSLSLLRLTSKSIRLTGILNIVLVEAEVVVAAIVVVATVVVLTVVLTIVLSVVLPVVLAVVLPVVLAAVVALSTIVALSTKLGIGDTCREDKGDESRKPHVEVLK